MDSHGKDKIFLIDGYPRNIENWEGFKEVFGSDFQIIATLFLSCDEKTCVDRLLNRGQTSGRSDDEEQVIKKRFNTFYNESLQVLDSLKQASPFIEIDSTKTPEEVTNEVVSEFQQLF
jgi:UMP-CMP kinase